MLANRIKLGYSLMHCYASILWQNASVKWINREWHTFYGYNGVNPFNVCFSDNAPAISITGGLAIH